MRFLLGIGSLPSTGKLPSCQNTPGPFVNSAEHPSISKIYLSDVIVGKIDDATDNKSGKNSTFSKEKRAHRALF
jgi:hypothetical protein